MLRGCVCSWALKPSLCCTRCSSAGALSHPASLMTLFSQLTPDSTTQRPSPHHLRSHSEITTVSPAKPLAPPHTLLRGLSPHACLVLTSFSKENLTGTLKQENTGTTFPARVPFAAWLRMQMPSGCRSNCTYTQKSQYLHVSSLPSGLSWAICSACAHVCWVSSSAASTCKAEAALWGTGTLRALVL